MWYQKCVDVLSNTNLSMYYLYTHTICNTHSGPRPSNVAPIRLQWIRSHISNTLPPIIARNQHTTNSENLYNIAISIHVFFFCKFYFTKFLVFFRACIFFLLFSSYFLRFKTQKNFNLFSTLWIVKFNDFSE